MSWGNRQSTNPVVASIFPVTASTWTALENREHIIDVYCVSVECFPRWHCLPLLVLGRWRSDWASLWRSDYEPSFDAQSSVNIVPGTDQLVKLVKSNWLQLRRYDIGLEVKQLVVVTITEYNNDIGLEVKQLIVVTITEYNYVIVLEVKQLFVVLTTDCSRKKW